MKKLASTLLLLLFTVAFSSSAFTAQILLKGKVTDIYSGKPMGVTMKFETKSGQIIKIKSDDVSGEYSQLFESGTEYEVTFINKEIVRTTESFKTEDVSTYKEFERNFTVKHLVKGLLFMDVDIFESGSSNLNHKFEDALKELEEVMKFNRNVKFYFVVSLNDVAEKSRSGKTSLLEERKTKLEEKVNNLGRDAKRIQVKSESTCKKGKNNLAIIVKSIESLLK